MKIKTIEAAGLLTCDAREEYFDILLDFPAPITAKPRHGYWLSNVLKDEGLFNVKKNVLVRIHIEVEEMPDEDKEA